MQIVFLSKRPEVLGGTLNAVRAHMKFVDAVLVVAPSSLAGGFDVPVITDEELCGELPADHQARNYALRSALARHDLVQEVFLMSDDDSRPLVEIPEETFVQNGRHRRYTFGWLDDWEHTSTSFDRGQLASRQILGLRGFPRAAYASHMPQVVDKALLAEVSDLLRPYAGAHPVCEWAAYFNVAPAQHPDRFDEPEPYLALGWPENPAAWQPGVEPGGFAFENFFPDHYLPGEVFAGIDPADLTASAAAEKAVRWRLYELQVLSGEREPVIGGTPAAGSPLTEALRQVRSRTVGDPLARERQLHALLASVRRAIRRR